MSDDDVTTETEAPEAEATTEEPAAEADVAVDEAVDAPAEAAPEVEAVADEAPAEDAAADEPVADDTADAVAEAPADESDAEATEVDAPAAEVDETPEAVSEAFGPVRVARVFVCERGHRTTTLWDVPTTCQARLTRQGQECGQPLYHITELPEQVQKALNPLKASKKASKKK